ncbi:hypothetical protein [Halococcus hamelinensis]|uniref:Uncharacterized protein n=1 Tax=Halococcus hamelinensis 100A6 TaxID=1132509 RepID=M0M384_9EURY|nr:hypothetical protein [Halococcus hamelinensis]EMA39044.1 hypothetical protein C447_07803 [Halococcus hamelinensis 100A6]
MSRADLGRVIESERTNAWLAWGVVVAVGASAVAATVRGNLLGALFAASIVVVAVLPPASFRSRWTMVPWEILAIAAFPTLGRAVAPAVVGDVATYVSVAALALVVAVELHLFTAIEMSYRFAVAFVVLTTMATAGVWALVRWVADGYLGTGFLTTETALMWEFVASTVAGVGAGIVFEGYVRRRVHTDRFPGAKR